MQSMARTIITMHVLFTRPLSTLARSLSSNNALTNRTSGLNASTSCKHRRCCNKRLILGCTLEVQAGLAEPTAELI
jgi:hypothetical protein